MEKEVSTRLVQDHQIKLHLTDKQFSRWAGKRYIVLIGVKDVQTIDSFGIDKNNHGNMDDWLLVDDITSVKLP